MSDPTSTEESWLSTTDGSVPVTPGVLDEDARFALTNGHCYALALAINRRTGWQIVGFADPDEQVEYEAELAAGPDVDDDGYVYEIEPPVIQHAAVLTPDGKMLDGNGLHDRFPAYQELTRAQAVDCLYNGYCNDSTQELLEDLGLVVLVLTQAGYPDTVSA